jgi:hypothetical protein
MQKSYSNSGIYQALVLFTNVVLPENVRLFPDEQNIRNQRII